VITKERTETTSKVKKYALSFTIGALLRQESVRLAELYVELGNWDRVREVAVAQNLLQMRTTKSSVRLCQEICSRLKTLNDKELALLIEGSVQDRGYLLWLVMCRRYSFIRDFAVEVIREKLLSLDTKLDYTDFETFFNKKAEWHPELDALKGVTRVKARGALFKMLREAEILREDNKISPAMLSRSLLNEVLSRGQGELRLFPVLESQIMGGR
jgi:hypothetical protein